jgi:hypothetical protein
MAVSNSIRYGYISRECAQSLGFVSPTASGGIINTDEGYLAALPPAMHHYIIREVDASTWNAALEHDAWLQEQCGI